MQTAAAVLYVTLLAATSQDLNTTFPRRTASKDSAFVDFEWAAPLPRPQLLQAVFLEAGKCWTSPDSCLYQAAASNTLGLPLKRLSAAMSHCYSTKHSPARSSSRDISLGEGQQGASRGRRREHRAPRSVFLLFKNKKRGIYNWIFLAPKAHSRFTVSLRCKK